MNDNPGLEGMARNDDFKTMLTEQGKLIDEMVRERRSERRWTWFKRAGLVLMFSVFFGIGIYNYIQIYGWKVPIVEDSIGVVAIDGEIREGFADRVYPALEKAFTNPKIKQIILKISSPGGSPVEAEKLYTAMSVLRAKNEKPVTAVVDGMAASAGYLIAIHADKIVASDFSLIGSIGAIMQTWNYSAIIDKFQLANVTIKSGAMKDMLNPYHTVKPAHEAKASELVNWTAKLFAERVEKQRGSKLKKPIAELTSGEVWAAPDAQSLGLIDGRGTVVSVADEAGLKVVFLGPHAQPSLLKAFGASVAEGFMDGVQASLHGLAATPVAEVK